jgi:hypothetical protein
LIFSRCDLRAAAESFLLAMNRLKLDEEFRCTGKQSSKVGCIPWKSYEIKQRVLIVMHSRSVCFVFEEAQIRVRKPTIPMPSSCAELLLTANQKHSPLKMGRNQRELIKEI